MINNLLLEEYFNYLQTNEGKSENTIKNYEKDLELLFEFLIKRKNENISIKDVDINFLEQITFQDLTAFITYLDNNRNNSNSTKARRIAAIKSFFNYLVDVEYINKNPAKKLKSPKLPERQPIYLTLSEVKRLLSVIYNKRDYAIIILFLNTGLRLSELVSIDIDKIKGDTLTVVGKGNKERTIYLNEICIEAINEYLKVRPNVDSKALFISNKKNRIDTRTVQRMVKKYIRRAGLNDNITVHKLRHTFATISYLHSGVDILTLKEMLGHSNVSTTQIYTHIEDNSLRKAVQNNPLNKL